MKTPLDPRHTKRQKTIEELFKVEFHQQKIIINQLTGMPLALEAKQLKNILMQVLVPIMNALPAKKQKKNWKTE